MQVRFKPIVLVMICGLASAATLQAGPASHSGPAAPQVLYGPGDETIPEPVPKVAILDFKAGAKVTPDDAAMLADLVRDVFAKSGKYEVLDRKMMKERLGEKDLQTLPEFEATKDLAACGKSLGVQKIVSGKATAFGDSWVLNVEIVDVATGRVDGTRTRDYTGQMSGLLGLAPTIAHELLGDAIQADEIANIERTRQEQKRRENLQRLWDEQKVAIVTRFKKADPPTTDDKGVYYRVEAENPTDQPAADVIVELRGDKKSEVRQVRFKEISAHGKKHKTIPWEWKGKLRECVVISVGGKFDLPKASQCKTCKGAGTVLCRNCLGKGYKDCRKCRGTGVFVEQYYEQNGQYKVPREHKITCPACGGSGKEACTFCKKGAKTCPKCHGGGMAGDDKHP